MGDEVRFRPQDITHATFWEEGAIVDDPVIGEDSEKASEDMLFLVLNDGIDRPPIRGPLARWLADDLAAKGVEVQWKFREK